MVNRERVCVCVLTSWGARCRASFPDASREPDSRFDAADCQQLRVPTVPALLLPEVRQQGETPGMLISAVVGSSCFSHIQWNKNSSLVTYWLLNRDASLNFTW